MNNLKQALSEGNDTLNAYLSTVNTPQFRIEVAELMQPSIAPRDQFAMAALQGILASTPMEQVDPHSYFMTNNTKKAYKYADAMLKAREEV